MACSLGFILLVWYISVYVVPLSGPLLFSPEWRLVEVFGEDKQELIRECLNKYYREDIAPFGALVQINPYVLGTTLVINGFLLLFSNCACLWLSKRCSRG